MSDKTKINDGGSAFPVLRESGNPDMPLFMASAGMTLRDWFAGHCDRPGRAEIASAAGLTYFAGKVWSGPRMFIASFEEWWMGIPQAERFRLCAKVRYAYADAMLAAREKDGTK